MKRHLSHSDIKDAVICLADEIHRSGIAERPIKVFPVPRGGIPIAYMLYSYLNIIIVNEIAHADLIVDDLIDSGATKTKYQWTGKPFAAAFSKHPIKIGLVGRNLPPNEWVVFPWEDSAEGSAEDIGIRLLQFIGEDVTREGLLDTPARMVRAWQEWTSGYGQDPSTLFKDFGDGAEDYDEMVIIDPIPFYSHCEHHLAAIFGTAHIAYIPNRRIAGLSKFARLVDVYARRLQVQERLTTQIANDIMKYLDPLGCAVVIRARHFCMESRGAKKPGSDTQTIALRGAFKTQPETRAEFFSLIKGR